MEETQNFTSTGTRWLNIKLQTAKFWGVYLTTKLNWRLYTKAKKKTFPKIEHGPGVRTQKTLLYLSL